MTADNRSYVYLCEPCAVAYVDWQGNDPDVTLLMQYMGQVRGRPRCGACRRRTAFYCVKAPE